MFPLSDRDSAFPLFRFDDIYLQTRHESWIYRLALDEASRLLVFVEGSGSLDCDGHFTAFRTGSCYYLAPGSTCHFYCAPGKRLAYYCVSFQSYHANRHGGATVLSEAASPLDFGQNRSLCQTTEASFNKLTHLLDALLSLRSTEQEKSGSALSPRSDEQEPSDGASDFRLAKQDALLKDDAAVKPAASIAGSGQVGLSPLRRQVYFHELLLHLAELATEQSADNEAARAVQESIGFMERRFMEPLTVAQLAQQASLPQWQYRSMFKELTGKKPNEYLTELRILHAKHSLAEGIRPLRDIAAEAGFSDEYYFSRRFKQVTGTTPRQYGDSARKRQSVVDWTGHEIWIPLNPEAILCHKEVCGDLNALGLPASGSLDGWLKTDLAGNAAPRNREQAIRQGITRKGSPDLILFANSDEGEYNIVSPIAPTVTFNSFASLDNRMETLGKLLNRQRDAKLWLNQFRDREKEMWLGLGSDGARGKTATVLLHEHGKRFFVMGSAGFAPALYHRFGFRPTPPVAQMLETEEGFREISEQEIPHYAGDCIFLLLSRNPVSRAATRRLIHSTHWNGLDAAKRNRVYVIEADKWNHGDALSRLSALEHLYRLLKGTS